MAPRVLMRNFETDELNPLTPYAISKIEVERYLEQIEKGVVKFTSLRFATACGVSPRFRKDLAVNDFVYGAIKDKKIVLNSDGRAQDLLSTLGIWEKPLFGH